MSRSKPLGQAHPVVVDGDSEPARDPLRLDHDRPRAARLLRRLLGVAVLHGVLEELGQHHRQRGGGLVGQQPERPLPAYDEPVGARADVGDHHPEPVGDLVEPDLVEHLLAQRLVHDRDRADPADSLLEGQLGLRGVDPPCLEAQQGGHRLQVVLHPVVDLADRGVLGDQLPVAPAQVGDVAHQYQGADVLALGAERDRPHDQRDPVVADLGVAVHPPAEHRTQRLLVRTASRRHE